MSLGCGEGSEIIKPGRNFSLVYMLGTNEEGLTFPDGSGNKIYGGLAISSRDVSMTGEFRYLTEKTMKNTSQMHLGL